MTQLEWYRQTEWTREIEDEFERRLSRSRGQGPEYLRIQAITLADQHKPDLALAAINLAKRHLGLSEKGISSAQMWAIIAQANVILGRHDDAVNAFRHSILREFERPNVRGYHYVDFAWYVATNSVVELYPEVLAAIGTNMQKQDLVFPATQFRYFGALALIADDSGEQSDSQRMAQKAIDAADVNRGPFWRYPFLGLFSQRKDSVHSRLERLAKVS